MTTLGTCVDQLAGHAFKSRHFGDDGEGTRLLRGDNIAPGHVRWSGAKTYPLHLTKEHDRYTLRRGDVVVAMDRPWIDAGLKVARIQDSDVPALLVQRVTRLRALNGVEQSYVWALVRSPRFTTHLRSETTGSAIPHISGKQIASFPVRLPPLPEQRAIASVLDALDDKIESNRRLASHARDVLLQAAPRAGDSTQLDDVAGFRNGGALTKLATGDGLPILRIKEMKAGVTADTPRTSAAVRQQHEISTGDLLFSWSGTLLTHRWSGEPAVLNQHIFRVDPIEGIPRWLVEAWIEQHLATFRGIAADKATTMGHIQRHHLSEAAVLVPDAAALVALRGLWDPVDAMRMGALAEARALTALRDALLPKLVSGQIRVPLTDDPDEALGAARNDLLRRSA